MSDHCCAGGCASSAAQTPRYRRALWIALIVNATMFAIEIIGSSQASSSSLLADAIDFFGDAANYAVSLLVLSMGALWRSRAALVKGLSMGAFGCFVLGKTLWNVTAGTLPEPITMGAVGLLALLANLGVAGLLYAFRDGDANMRSVWLCTRNDAIGNVLVMLAAVGVFGTGSGWPDWIVAAVMGILALSAAISVVRHARAEMAEQHLQAAVTHQGHTH